MANNAQAKKKSSTTSKSANKKKSASSKSTAVKANVSSTKKTTKTTEILKIFYLSTCAIRTFSCCHTFFFFISKQILKHIPSPHHSKTTHVIVWFTNCVL